MYQSCVLLLMLVAGVELALQIEWELAADMPKQENPEKQCSEDIAFWSAHA